MIPWIKRQTKIRYCGNHDNIRISKTIVGRVIECADPNLDLYFCQFPYGVEIKDGKRLLHKPFRTILYGKDFKVVE